MGTQKILILGLLLIFQAFCLADLIPIDQWAVQEFWFKLEAKMTEQQAVELIGEPQDKEEVNSSRIWYYSEPLQWQGNRIASRPKSGYLHFKQCNDGSYMLANWKEPDWNIVASYTEKQYLTTQSRIDAQKARELQALERQTLMEQQKIEAEKKKAEQQAARQKQIEKRAKNRAKLQASAQQENIPNGSQQVETSTKQKHQKDNWFIDNIMIITCVLGVIVLGGVFVYKQ